MSDWQQPCRLVLEAYERKGFFIEFGRDAIQTTRGGAFCCSDLRLRASGTATRAASTLT